MPRFIRRRPIDLDVLKQRAFQRRRGAMIEQLERRTLLSAGDLDTTFSGDGKVTTDLGTGEHAAKVVVQDDGKILVAGAANGDGQLVRYNLDGTLDTSFSGDGIVRLGFSGGTNESFNDVVLLPDGRILAAGNQSDTKMWIARYSASGQLDGSGGFGGGDGIYHANGQITELELQGDNIITADTAGNVRRHSGSTGAVDSTFGGGGTTFLGTAPFDNFVLHDLFTTADGKIVAAGETWELVAPEHGEMVFAIARLNADGSYDATFGNDGTPGDGRVIDESPYLGGRVTRIAAQGSKLIFIGREEDGDSALVRLNPDGSRDTSFGSSGRYGDGSSSDISITIETAIDVPFTTEVVVQDDGKIVVAGGLEVVQDGTWSHDFYVLRYAASGAIEESFGPTGGNAVDFQDSSGRSLEDLGRSVALAPDGRIVVAGEAYHGEVGYAPGGVELAVARFEGGPAEPPLDENVYIQDRVVHVDGTAGDDTITTNGLSHYNDRLTVTFNGDTFRFNDEDFDSILIRGFAGNDSLNDSASWDTLFDGGDGNDSVVTNGEMGAAFATVVGGAGDDSVRYDQSPNPSTRFDGGSGRDKITVSPVGTFAELDLRDFPSVEDGVIRGGNLTGNSLNNHLTIDDIGTVRGGDGDDILGGGFASFSVDLFGENGNDLLIGGGGGTTESPNTLDGGAGNDTLVSNGGTELLRGGAGTDEVTYASRTEDLRITLDDVANDGATGENDNVFSDIERIRGGSGADWIDGNAAGNILYGLAGNDTLVGFGGDDALFGGNDNDRIYGGTGDDYIEGNGGSDSLHGEAGLDQLRGHDGDDWLYTRDGLADTLNGDAGYDRADVNAIDSTTSIEEFLSEPPPDDNIYIDSAGILHVIGTSADDDMWVELNEDRTRIVAIMNGGERSFLASSVNGIDMQGLAGHDGFGNYGVTSVRATVVGGDGNDTFVSESVGDSFVGGNGNDTAHANAVENIPEFDGGAGGDKIYLRAGTLDLRDFPTIENGTLGDGGGTLYGNDLNNVLRLEGESAVGIYGFGGDDSLSSTYYGALGTLLDGGDGNDTLSATNNDGGNTLFGGAGHDRLHSFGSSEGPAGSYFDAGPGNDTISADWGSDTIYAGDGDDEISPSNGSDFVDAGAGNDSVDGLELPPSGGPYPFDDTVYGGAGNDTIGGGVGNNVLEGGIGDDTFETHGVDTVRGEDGNDVVNFSGETLTFEGGLAAADIDTLNVNRGALAFNSDVNATTANLVINVADDAAVTFNSTQHLHALNLADGAMVTMPANGDRFLFTRGLSIADTAKLDLADNDLLWDYTGDSPYLTARDWVATGRAGTSGITSSTSTGKTVLALVDNAIYGKTSWNGQDIDETTLIGKYTYYGDANLDGKVTGDDYVAIDSNLGKTDAQWIHGDFNFDGRTSGDDYVSIDANLGMGTTDPASYDELQADMITIHAESYGGKEYEKKVAQAERGKTRPEPRGKPAGRAQRR